MSTEKDVNIVVTFKHGAIDDLLNKNTDNINGLEKLLKLHTSYSTTNIHAFDEHGRLKLFKSAEEIIHYFIPVRLGLYEKRRLKQIKTLSDELDILQNKVRFIQDVLSNTIDLRGKTKENVHTMMIDKNYKMVSDSFKYLTKMPMDMVTEENIKKLNNEKDLYEQKVKELTSTSAKTIWLNELTILEKNL